MKRLIEKYKQRAGIFLVMLSVSQGINYHDISYDFFVHAIPLEVESGIHGKARRVRFEGHTYDTYTVNTLTTPIRLFWKDPSGNIFGSLRNLKQWLNDNEQTLLFATNAGIYTPQNSPKGLYIENEKKLVPLDLEDGKGNFYLKPNGIFLIIGTGARIIESSTYSAIPEPVISAIQSGPLLVHHGNIHPVFRKGSTSTFIRNGVGIIDTHTVVFVISNEAVNLYEFATIFKEFFGCQDALYLDGAISRMYLPELHRYELDGNVAGIIGITQPQPH